MLNKEKKLLWIFIGLLILTLVVKIIPWLIRSYETDLEEISQLKEKRRYFNDLVQLKQKWKQIYQQRLEVEQILIKETYQGNSRELVAASIQSDLGNIARNHNVSTQSMNLPEFQQNEEMLLIIQKMYFKTDEKPLLDMLNTIYHHVPRLILIDFQVSKFGRNQLSGHISVIGFYKLSEESSIQIRQEKKTQ